MSAPAVVAPGPTQEHTADATRAGGEVAAPEVEVLTRVPRPGPDQSVVDLTGRVAGGLQARSAQWEVDGGQVLLVGDAPFLAMTGRAGFRSDGSLDGTVALNAAVRLLGLDVATAQWAVAGWSAHDALTAPTVQLRGTTLAIDVSGVGAEVTLSGAEGFAVTRSGPTITIDLPDGTLPPGIPLEPRVVELFRGLRGWDVSGLRAHPDSPVEAAPAFVSNRDLFFAPSRYGADSRETAALLEAAVRAALAGAVGAVGPTPPAPPPQPAPGEQPPPVADTAPVPAAVAPVPPAGARADAEATGADGLAGEAAGGEATGAEAGTAGGAAPTGTEAPPAGEAGDAAAGPAPVAVEVELLMPPAPTAPGPAAQQRSAAVGRGAGGAARAARDLPTADATVAAARGAVTEPVAETAARAREDLAAALGERPAPSPEIVALCERIRTAIREHRPVDEDELLSSDPTREAGEAGATVTGSVEGQVQSVEGGYDALDSPPDGAPALSPTAVVPPEPTSPGMGVDASSAAPDAIAAENLSLDADVAATDQRIADAGVDTRVTQAIPTAPFATVRDSRGELGEMAQQTPAELAAEQTAAIESAQGDMAALQQQATQALLAARSGAVGQVTGGQQGTVTGEQDTREAVGLRAQQVFTTAQTSVNTLLQPLSRTAIARWESGLARLSQEFHDALDAVQRWVDERHSGVDGFVVGLGDAVFGLPDWVLREYDRAEQAFGDGVCTLLLDISTEVNSVVAAAQALVSQARDDIDTMFTAMEDTFPGWAEQERARFSGMLDGLSSRVTEAQTSFVQDVSHRATQAVAEAQAAVEERREAARGVVGRIVAAIEAFIEDPVTAIINGLLTLVGIPPAAFWALVTRIQHVVADIANDPESFINNLVAGLKLGFEQFFGNFGTHVLAGFWRWLFSGLATPIPMPTEFSARALFTFALQLMGITWPRVREILVTHIGAENVELIEKAWELVSVLISRGPEGLVEMVREQLSPEVIVQTILEAAVQYLVETLIEQVVVRVIGMLNPAGAIAQAIDLIYQICAWVFRNAARIFRFVEAVVNGLADVVAGNIAGMANAVERALASMIPVAIDFLAGLLHMGDLPDQVAEVIVALQARVYAVMDRIIGWLAAQGRALLAALGLGGEDDDEPADNDDEELGTTVRFTADGESHRVWFDVSGDDATLMVASVPAPIEAKIAEWRGMVAGLAADQQDDATAQITALETVATEASAQGDELAAEFLAAAAAADDELEPPSDNALENRQRAIAGMLDRLFTLFGQTNEAEALRDIADQLPGHGVARADTIVASWAALIEDETYLPLDADAGRPIWDPAVLAAAAKAAGAAVLASPATHLELVPWFTGPTTRRGGAGSGAFRDYALVALGPTPPHTVRTQFQEALGSAYAAAMRSNVPADLDPIDTDLEATIGAVAYEGATRPYGRFASLPGRAGATDPPLITAVGGSAGVMSFFRDMVTARTSGGYRWARFTWAWGQRPSHDYVAAAVRGVSPRSHEWIPTSEVRNLVEHAIQQAAMHPNDLSRSVGWVQFFDALRSSTADVAYYIRSGPTLSTDPRPARTPVTDTGIGAHSGGQSADEAGVYTRGTIGQGPFHDWLRQVYYQQRDAGPIAFGQSLISRLGYEIWDGTLTEALAPRAVWFQPIDLYFTVDGEGSRAHGLTLAELAMRQREAWHRIQSDFTRALYSVDV